MERNLPKTQPSSLPSNLNDVLLKDDNERLVHAWARHKHSGEVLLGGEDLGKVVSAVKP
jgi:hypothetical protein